MGKILCLGLDELPDAAASILHACSPFRIFLLKGQMGAGKTTLIKAFCQVMQISDQASSPTFAIVNEYLSPSHGLIYHFDLYRLEHPDELLNIGFEEYIDSGCYCFIEWPELSMELLPPPFVEISIEADPVSGLRTVSWLAQSE
jgi:tRNA threonylcarbamoyladenosine biosynthesis protein TsaE